jgi:hypothetical protein
MAAAAYRSSEPVFNNRFIRLFWHNKDKQNDMEKDKCEVRTGQPMMGASTWFGLFNGVLT